MIERIKNIILQPKQEWVKIDQEQPDTMKILTGYVLPLVLIPTIFTILGWGLVGKSYGGFLGVSMKLKGWEWGIQQGVILFISQILMVYVSALVIDLLSGSFKSEKNFGKSFQLVAYAMTPMWVAGVFYIIPSLGFLVFIAGIYGLVILYHGVAPIKKTPVESVTGYFVVSLLTIIVAMIVVSLIIGLIISSVWLSKSAMIGWG
ncbi:MAG: Yip1 family protein [Bacteroidales bacterium]|nr:Yip1 family protein [Bacteroidales bacterium]